MIIILETLRKINFTNTICCEMIASTTTCCCRITQEDLPMSTNDTPASIAHDTASVLGCLTKGAKVADCVEKINELLVRMATLEARMDEAPKAPAPGTGVRNYGPASQRKMEDWDAWRIMYGDLKATKVKDIAKLLGLSHGQVYSVRGNYTFTHVKPESFKIEPPKAEEAQVEEAAK
jgi:hypothetical protein